MFNTGWQRLNNTFYTTYTILNWIPFLKKNVRKDIVKEALQFHVDKGTIKIYAYVILDNHMHILYEVASSYSNFQFKHSFASYTSKLILQSLTEVELASCHVMKCNRKYQIWKSPALSVEIYSRKFYRQKLNYIHKNVVRAGLKPDYEYSSLRSCVESSVVDPLLLMPPSSEDTSFLSSEEA